jgi:hypothetical protein
MGFLIPSRSSRDKPLHLLLDKIPYLVEDVITVAYSEIVHPASIHSIDCPDHFFQRFVHGDLEVCKNWFLFYKKSAEVIKLIINLYKTPTCRTEYSGNYRVGFRSLLLCWARPNLMLQNPLVNKK